MRKGKPPTAKGKGQGTGDTPKGTGDLKGPRAKGQSGKGNAPEEAITHPRPACDAMLVSLFALWPRLTATLRRRGATHHDAEDAAADSYLALYERLLGGGLPLDPTLLKTSLNGLARERLRTIWRHNRPTTKSLDVVMRDPHQYEEIPTIRPAAEVAALRDEFRHLAATARQELSPRQRQVLHARLSRLTYTEIAGILGTSSGATRVHWTNALGRIRRMAA